MDVSDSTVGKVVLLWTVTVFLVLAFWVNTYPFIDEETVIYSYIPNPSWFLLACAGWGVCFIGGLMAFSLYHLSVTTLQGFVIVFRICKRCTQNMTSSGDMAGTVDATKRSEWIIVGISGVTCGGKTTLANRLMASIHPAVVFHQDKYFYPDDSHHHVRCHDIPHNNYDILSSLDMAAFHRDVLQTIQGQSKAHATSTGEGRVESLSGKKLLIIEGFTVLNYKPLNDLCDLRYYFILDYSQCLQRRVYRLYDPPDIDGYFDKCVWPEHLKYRAEIERDKRVKLIDGTAQDTFENVMNEIRTLADIRRP